MADIDQIIAGGAGASSRADFSGVAGIPQAYFDARDQKAKNDLRDAFKGGVPLTPDGQPDFSAMAKTLYQKGGLDQGNAASNLGIQRDQLRLGQDASAAMGRAESGGPQQPIVGPSASRNSVTIDPSKRADATTSQPQQPAQQPTIMTVLAAQGIPNDQLGAASASISRQLGVDPSAPLDVNDPQVRNVLAPAVAQLKRQGLGQVQPPQPGDNAPQGQPNPQQNQGTFGAPSATPTRGTVPTGTDPEIQKQIATYTAIASNPAYPKSVQEAALTRLKALQDQTSPTPDIKNYDLYRRQGGNLPFNEWQADNESRKSTSTEQAKADITEQQEYIKAGKVASDRLTTLNTLSNIISSDKSLTLGFGADTALKVKMALKQIGIDTGDLSGAESIQKLNALLASESTKAISPRPAQFEFKTFLSNNPGLSLDKAGNERVIGIFSQLAKREVDLGRLARQNRDNWNGWDTVVEGYDKTHPIIDPVSRKPITTDSIVAPGPAKTTAQGPSPVSISSKADYDKLPSGTKFTGPDGKPWQKP